MMDLYYAGGSLFMGILTLLFLVMMVFAVLNAIQLLNKKSIADTQLSAVKSVGLFAMVFGILAQLIGLFGVLDAVEQLGKVSQPLLAGGLKVSSISTIYGLIIFLLSYLIWFGETHWCSRQKD